ncbi:spore gernimation protein GerD [Halalkalibacillus sediminis]|uniref:Spore gernimation protein GerD n=1 Tax=Halalkalibacillus sediminis TaxID=2018042 RepID=A0A2I0QQG2_9BACI|nr:spore germination lipoprotein GerD [Halalkalibacillus sediminis]PKR76538.1 spore gernimation protein GerD [Halalkalibacillus sediminis]
MKKIIMISIALIFALTACAQGGGESKENPDYEATKKMVVDILKTDDGKKALTEVLSAEETKSQLVIDSETVKQSLEQTMDSEKGKEFWKKLYEDPSFVQSYVNATQEHDKELIKGLMNDSTYQEQLISIFQNEQMQQTIIGALKSQPFRAHLEETIQETLNSPLFKAKMTETLLQAAEKAKQSEEGQGGSQQQGQGGGESGEQGGGGEQGGEGSS